MQILVGGRLYECSVDGKILKRRGKGCYKETEDKDGYLKYHIRDYDTKVTHNLMVHRIVWEVFNGEIPEGMTVDHIDSDKQNNHISNLQLLTPEENAVYNLEQFCRDNNLHAGHLREIAKGKLRQYKGWTCYEHDQH